MHFYFIIIFYFIAQEKGNNPLILHIKFRLLVTRKTEQSVWTAVVRKSGYIWGTGHLMNDKNFRTAL